MIYAFGYGSLVSRESLAISLGRPVERNTLVPAELTGYRRTWNVATDNRVRLPGYKVYVDDAGRRPGVAIAFLGVEAVRGRGRERRAGAGERGRARAPRSARAQLRSRGGHRTDHETSAYRGRSADRDVPATPAGQGQSADGARRGKAAHDTGVRTPGSRGFRGARGRAPRAVRAHDGADRLRRRGSSAPGRPPDRRFGTQRSASPVLSPGGRRPWRAK